MNNIDNSNEELYDPFFDDGSYGDEDEGLDSCPNCGRDYDEIDQEFQKCHFCGYDADPEETPSSSPSKGEGDYVKERGEGRYEIGGIDHEG